MRLSNGHPYLAIPGPSVIPDAVQRAMHRTSPNIYTGELNDMTDGIIPDLKRVARTVHNVAIYTSNGHGIWEAALTNVIKAGDKVLVPSCGRFGHGWAEVAENMGANVELIDFGMRNPMDVARVSTALDADKAHEIKAILVTHVDTSSSVVNDIAAMRAAMDALGHPALLMVDCIASMGCDRFEMDKWGVDVAIAASQKGLMVPPGLGFVFFNDKAAAVRKTLSQVSLYWDWTKRADPDVFYQYFHGTAPTHHLYGLRAALDMIHEEGMENVWARHHTLARTIWTACDLWGAGGPIELNVVKSNERSTAVTAVRIGAPAGLDLRNWLEDMTGVTLGIGLGMVTAEDPNGEGFFRIGHMGHVNAHMVLGVLGTMQAGFEALGIPYGPGALDGAARVVSGKA